MSQFLLQEQVSGSAGQGLEDGRQEVQEGAWTEKIRDLVMQLMDQLNVPAEQYEPRLDNIINEIDQIAQDAYGDGLMDGFAQSDTVISILRSRIKRYTVIIKSKEQVIQNFEHVFRRSRSTDAKTKVATLDDFKTWMGHGIIGERRRLWFLLFVTDLEGFKAINDELGHDVGDQKIIAFAEHLKQNVRQYDLIGQSPSAVWANEQMKVARIAGDAFAVGLTVSSYDDAERLFERFVREATILPCHIGALCLSLGSIQRSNDLVEQLLEKGDECMRLDRQRKIIGLSSSEIPLLPIEFIEGKLCIVEKTPQPR